MELLLHYLVKSAGLLTVFYALYYFLLRKDHSFATNRKFLLGGLFASAVLPSVYYTKKVFIEASTTQFQLMEGDFPVSELSTPDPLITPVQIIIGLYFMGVVFMAGRMLVQLISLCKVLANGKITKTGKISYIEVTGKMAPFSFLHYIVYNPALHLEKELLHILKHEKVHVNQWHTLDVLLANLNLIFQWCNPVAWFYVKILQQNLEFIADSEAVKEAPCIKEYQTALVKVSVENFNPALTNSFYQSFIKKRIVMLNSNTTPRNNYWKASLAFPLMIAFIFLFNVTTEAQIIDPENPQEETTSNLDQTLRISANISKESNEERLNHLKDIFAKQDVILDYKNIQRSPEGFITAITVSFLNKKNNNSGVTNYNNPDGIDAFEIYMENGRMGFVNTATKKEKERTAKDIVSKAGKNVLFIVNGKEYTSSELAGNSIEILEGFIFLTPENSLQYGDRGKDGVIMISKGRIIDDIQEEMKNIDSENLPAQRSYIHIRKGEKPMFVEVEKNRDNLSNSKETLDVKTFSTSKSGAQSLDSIPGNPVFVLNGEKVDREDLQDIPPSSIKHITVLKGQDATSIYGKAAKDGAVLISTHTKKMVVGTGVTFSTDEAKDNLKLYKDMMSQPGAPMVILDGKIQDENFKLSDLDPAQIGEMAITKGSDVETTYGDRAKDGVLKITTKTSRANKDSRVYRMTHNNNGDINASQFGTKQNPSSSFIIKNPQGKPLYIVDDIEMGKDFDASELEPDNISSINVLKGPSSTLKYGDKGKEGVIEITTINSSNKGAKFKYGIITAHANAQGLQSIKDQLKSEHNLEVTFEDVKRNRKGLITAIKINAKHQNKAASATYQVEEGVPNVYIGLSEDTIIISSNPPKK